MSDSTASDCCVAVLATLDTKGEEAQFVAQCLTLHGKRPWIVDLGISGAPILEGDTPRAVIARRAGRTLEEIAALPRSDALRVVSAAATPILAELQAERKVAGVIGLGGGTGSWLCNEVMRDLPLGFPKLLVSTLPAHDASIDVVIMPAVADVAGLNSVLRPILVNAAGAVCGMIDRAEPVRSSSGASIAMTMFGVNTEGATFARRFLEAAGCEVVVFHSNGAGGRTMEGLLAKGLFDAVLDWSITELTDEIAGGVCTAGPQRLEAAGRRGIPQLVVPGAIDVINFFNTVPDRLKDRRFHMHLPTVSLVRASADECRKVGEVAAAKLNAARGPVHVLIPEGGYSALDRAGGPFEDKAADAAFVDALRANLTPAIPIELRPEHINSERFARAAADAMLRLTGDASENRLANADAG
jgi:uncharacterized protein (UPF0261 family)